MSEELKARILAAIWSLVRGFGATIPEIRTQPALMTLECVVAEATAEGRTAASLDEVAGTVVRFLEEAADSLAQAPDATTVPNRAKAARAALSLKPELHARPYQAVKGREGRQLVISEWLDSPRESLDNKRQDGTSPMSDLIDPVAERLTLREIDYLINERRRAQRARRPPLESAMRVEWLGRFERYFKMWAPVSGLRHDLELALDARQRGGGAETDLFIRKSLYHHARFLTELGSFISQHGGLWILPDTRTEDAIADSSWFIREPMRLGEVNESILRMTFENASEVTLFMHATYTDRHVQPILDVWREWIQSCRCSRLNRPRNDCRVHATIRWASFYMDALEAQWDFLADWYDLPRPGTKIDPVRQRRRGLPVLPPPLPVDNQVQMR